jgi:hypothetical protein
MLHRRGSSVTSLGEEAFAIAYYRNLIRYASRHHAERLPLIRAGIRASLVFRAALRPSRRRAYRAALASLDAN